MAKGLWERILCWIGFETDEAEEVEIVGGGSGVKGKSEFTEEWVEDLGAGGKKRGTLVSLPGQKQLKVVVVEPKSFEEVQTIADHLKNRRPIILNLETTEREHAQRVLNFLSGAIYALNGDMQRISNGIFFFAPGNVDVSLMKTSGARVEEANGRAPTPGEFLAGGVGVGPGSEKRVQLNTNVPGGIGRDREDKTADERVNLWKK